MAKLAAPEESVPVPRVAAPSLKVTVPVGTPTVDVTVAVNVTDWPTHDGFRLETRAVPVAAGLTTRPLVAPLNTWTEVAEKFAPMTSVPPRRRSHRHRAGRGAGHRRRQHAARCGEPGTGQGDGAGRGGRSSAPLRVGHRHRDGGRLAEDDRIGPEGDRRLGRAGGHREAEGLRRLLRRPRGRVRDLCREREASRCRRGSRDDSSLRRS